MAGENNGPDEGGQGGNAGDSTGADGTDKSKDQGGNEGGDKFEPVTFKTQEEYDAAFQDRVDRAKTSTKTETLKAFTDAGATPEQALEAWKTWKAEEDKKKSPEALEREKREEAEGKLRAYEAKEAQERIRKEAAADPSLKITDNMQLPAELLSGTTKEEMVAHGKAIIAFFSGAAIPRAPGYNPDQGFNGQDTVKSGDPIRNFMNTGQFA